jgi:hypothetical protein
MRYKDANWILPEKLIHEAQVHTALLMDIRDELKRLNILLHCSNFTGMPATLRTISRKLPAITKKRRG